MSPTGTVQIGLDGVVEGIVIIVVALDASGLSIEDLGVGAALLEVPAAGDAASSAWTMAAQVKEMSRWFSWQVSHADRIWSLMFAAV